jgi:hypothetical protein
MVAKTPMKRTPQVFVHDFNPYIKVIPVKRLFNSTMVHEVVTRGDFFAVNLATGELTILPAGSDTPDIV